MTAEIVQLKQEMLTSKQKQDEAAQDIKRVEKEMIDFGKNKGSKLAELEASLVKLKSDLKTNLESIKPLEMEKREAEIDFEQHGSDLTSTQETLDDVELNLKAVQVEIDGLVSERTAAQVRRFYSVTMVHS